MKTPKTGQVYGRILYMLMASAVLSPQPAAAADDGKMRVGGRTSQPIGHYDYCSREVKDCRRLALSTRPTLLTRKRWQDLLEVNREANSLIRPVTDMEYYGVEEHWTIPEPQFGELAGDCEDYVLVKRQALMARGWPASSLLPTVVRRPNGEGHAVLTVRTNRGDFILDNLEDDIMTWNDTVYSFLKRVSAAHSGQWETIIDSRTLVGSID